MKCNRLIPIVLATMIAASTAGAVSAAATGDEDGRLSATSLLPASGEIAGWEMDGDLLYYVADNLWEYINGAAEQFLTYEFEEVAAQDYISEGGKDLKVEIYRHRTNLMAFGIYTQFRSPGYEFYDIGSESFGDEYSFHLWKGSFYVKINIFDEDPELAGAMRAFAGAVASKIEAEGDLPALLSCFPGEGLVEKSIIYVTEGVLGRSAFPPAFIADYRLGEAGGKLFLFQATGEEHAREVYDWYAGLTSAGTAERTASCGAYLAGDGTDKYRGGILLFRYGAGLGLVTGFQDAPELRLTIADEAVTLIGTIGGKD